MKLLRWLLLGALLAAGAGYAVTRPAPRPNVIIIDMDTLRADALGIYGGTQCPTPAIDAFARQGTVWEYAYTAFPHTVPSHAALFTGLLPVRTGVRSIVALPPPFLTLAQYLQAAGYRTAAFVSGWTVSRAYGLARGFDQYDDELPGSGTRRAGTQTIAAMENWLQAAPADGRPLFLWLHLFDMHAPYGLFAGMSEDWYAADDRESDPQLYPGKYVPGHLRQWDEQFSSLDAAAAEYYRALRTADANFAVAMRLLRRRGLLDNAVVVLLADHGEGLGDHDYYFDHGERVDQAEIRVPLIMVAPGRIPAGRRETRNVRLLDVMPTILDLLAAGPARGGLDGRSLLPMLREPRARDERLVYVEGGEYRPHMSYPTTLRGDSSRPHALLFGDFKYVNYAGRGEELYDVRSDPNEQHNLAATDPERCRDLALLMELYRSSATGNLPVTHDTGATVKLRSLGYLQ